MNKKLLALAIAAALVPAAAMADSGNVKISGSMHVSLDSLDNGADRNTNVSSNNSYINFSGDESLGNGLKAVWQVSTVVGMGETSAPAGANAMSMGNSYAGLGGGFGTVILGRHDTPLKMTGRKADLSGDQIGDSRNMIAAGGIGDLRADNVVAYISPNFSGFSAIVAHVTNTNAGAATDASTKAWSLNGTYESGPMMVGLAYEKHNAAGTSADPKELRLVAGYSFGDVKLVGLYQRSDDLNNTDGSDRRVWGLGAAYKMGATTLKGQYYKAGDKNSVDNTGAGMFALGADYSLSKRTTAYVAYAKTNNDSGATFNAFGGGHGDQPAVSGAGKDPSGFSLGMKHAF